MSHRGLSQFRTLPPLRRRCIGQISRWICLSVTILCVTRRSRMESVDYSKSVALVTRTTHACWRLTQHMIFRSLLSQQASETLPTLAKQYLFRRKREVSLYSYITFCLFYIYIYIYIYIYLFIYLLFNKLSLCPYMVRKPSISVILPDRYPVIYVNDHIWKCTADILSLIVCRPCWKKGSVCSVLRTF